MELGFETIGNATLICHDDGPLLATDTWIKGSAYFGSWITSHEIPEEQLANIKACKHIWISHGHPDHLSPESLEGLRDKEILLPDHYGGRIHKDLKAEGYNVKVLQDGVWTALSDKIRILSIGDYCQDAILLVDLDGRLIVNSNDASDNGAGPFVREIVSKYDRSFLMCLTGYGDADMINFFDEDGKRVPPPAMKHEPFIDGIEEILRAFGIEAYIPFSSQHKYQRTDSGWANDCATPLSAYAGGFSSSDKRLLTPFCRYDLIADEPTPINPKPRPDTLIAPEEFGDNWSDELEPGDVEKLEIYFRRIEHLQTFLGFVTFKVGGQEHRIEINPKFDRGLTFGTPRASLMTVIEYRVFDDLLIGNFTKTTLHGDWGGKEGTAALYPDFNPFVTKYGDNGGAYTVDQLKAYFAAYRERGFFGFPEHAGGQETARALAPYL